MPINMAPLGLTRIRRAQGEILADLAKLEAELQQGIRQLEGMLK